MYYIMQIKWEIPLNMTTKHILSLFVVAFLSIMSLSAQIDSFVKKYFPSVYKLVKRIEQNGTK